jgi:Ni/Co efflux regulator RcnB
VAAAAAAVAVVAVEASAAAAAMRVQLRARRREWCESDAARRKGTIERTQQRGAKSARRAAGRTKRAASGDYVGTTEWRQGGRVSGVGRRGDGVSGTDREL